MKDYTIHPKIYYRKRKSSKRKLLFIGLIAILVIIFLNKINIGNDLNKKGEEVKSVENKSRYDILNNRDSLLDKISQLLEKQAGSYSVYIYDLDSKSGFGINEETVLTAASVNKIPILASLYHLAGNNKIDLEKTISIQQKDIQDYGTGIIRYDNPLKTYSIKTLARLMMEKSDNTASYVLGTHILGIDKIQKLIDSWELTQTDMKQNKTSAKDMAKLLTKMYNGEITTSALTREMLGFMDRSDFDDRIPAGLPQGITVYHKTGNAMGKIHDVGIISLPQKPYFLGMLTIDAINEQATKQTMANISKMVFEYMSKPRATN